MFYYYLLIFAYSTYESLVYINLVRIDKLHTENNLMDCGLCGLNICLKNILQFLLKMVLLIKIKKF